MRRALTLAAAGLVAVGWALAGCTLEPHYVTPAPKIAPQWPTGPAYAAATSETALPGLSYREVFRDPALQGLIERALANNQNLAATLANVEIARAQYGEQRADLFPHVDANVSASEARSRVGTIAPGAASVGAEPRITRNYAAQLGLTSFEIDLFGRLRSLTHAARDAYLASAAGARAARITLVGEVARAYLALAADRTQLTISTETVASASQTVALTQARLSGGVAARTDLTQAQTLLDQARSDQQQRITQVAQDRNALELLVGGPVADAELPGGIEAIDGLIAQVPAGLDSAILLRRPDVVEAEYRLRAANAEIGAARAAFFPRISLTGLAGFASPALGALFHQGNYTWQAQGAASLPIFAGGANVAGLALAEAQRKQALANYQAAIQSAFRDVADALARRGTMEAQLAAQTDLLTAATTSYELQIARYREGIDPYLNALVTQRTLYSARQSQAATRLVRAANLVAIYQALGGDPLIDSMPPASPGPAPRGSGAAR